jgi:hypothetical protein
MTLTTRLMGGHPLGPDESLPLRMLVAFDIVFTLLSVAFVDTVLVG